MIVYLIGGAARVGKSTLARQVVGKTRGTLVPTDAIVFALQTAPQLNIRFPIMNDNADAVIPFVTAYVRYLTWGTFPVVVEGVALFPRHVATFEELDVPVRSVFLGHDNATAESIATGGGWAAGGTPADRELWASMTRQSSADARRECESLALRYIDVGTGWNDALAMAIGELTEPGGSP